MTKIYFNAKKDVHVKEGSTVLEGALKARVHLRHKCGGKGSCTTCKVKMSLSQPVSKPRPIEVRLLGEQMIHEGWRLACQTRVYGNVTVQTPEDPAREAIKSKLEQALQERKDNV